MACHHAVYSTAAIPHDHHYHTTTFTTHFHFRHERQFGLITAVYDRALLHLLPTATALLTHAGAVLPKPSRAPPLPWRTHSRSLPETVWFGSPLALAAQRRFALPTTCHRAPTILPHFTYRFHGSGYAACNTCRHRMTCGLFPTAVRHLPPAGRRHPPWRAGHNLPTPLLHLLSFSHIFYTKHYTFV